MIRNRQKLTPMFALLGFVVAIVIYASSAVIHTSKTPSQMEVFLGVISVLFCPPGLLNVLFFDIEAGTAPGAILWIVIALANAGLYAIIGALIGRLLRRRNRDSLI